MDLTLGGAAARARRERAAIAGAPEGRSAIFLSYLESWASPSIPRVRETRKTSCAFLKVSRRSMLAELPVRALFQESRASWLAAL